MPLEKTLAEVRRQIKLVESVVAMTKWVGPETDRFFAKWREIEKEVVEAQQKLLGGG